MKNATQDKAPARKGVTVLLHPDLYERLHRAAKNQSTPARRVTIADMLRHLIDTGC